MKYQHVALVTLRDLRVKVSFESETDNQRDHERRRIIAEKVAEVELPK